MSWNNGSRVLAVGIDAAEPTLIRKLIEQDEMPVLKSLMAQGRWLRVQSPAHIGSGSVWPTFITGEDAAKHGVYGEWSWQPETMGLRRYNGRHLKPFWKQLAQQGMRVGVFDVPFAPFLDFDEGFEVSEWGPHDLLEGRLQTAPAGVTNLVSTGSEPHPLSLDRLDTRGPRDYAGLRKLSSGCLEGVRRRGALAKRLMSQTDPQLSVIVFTEIHHSAHYMWHTLAPGDPLYINDVFDNLASVTPGLKDIYCEVDWQIGELLEAVGASAAVFVFSLHGMRPTHGVPAFLEPLLCELGYARRANWSSKSWTERAIALMAVAKRHTPKLLKSAYYRTLPPTTTIRLARPTMMATYDWKHTRAFALPADQHGWVHVNLSGREKNGSVSPQDYEETCQELDQVLRRLRASDGRPIVREVFRTARDVEEALTQRLPDLVVHWQDAAFSTPLRIEGSGFQTEPVGTKFTGRHALDGFCILRAPEGVYEGDTLPATDMHRLITKLLTG